jgi:hypothetical protein
MVVSKFLLSQHVDTYVGEWDVSANSTLELKNLGEAGAAAAAVNIGDLC